ncbi:MAG TPA: patatin-like phospholipase family protein [Candidatus Paceibacterota bacterium]|nr:patatin-like phospholipase family protein [Candidatus Paceibacterota bacterium]
MKIILAIDGGGIRGIVPAAILDYLERKIQEIQGDSRIRISSLFDFVSGTSTGSIVGSLMLVPGDRKNIPLYSMKEIMDLYIQMGPEVFKKNKWHNIKTLWGLFGPKFPASNIECPLIQILNHYKMKDLIKPCLFTGYDIDKRRVNIYTNRDATQKYGDYYVKDIVRGSTAIPAFFPPAYFQEGPETNTIVDGGVFANNPSMISYIEASKTLFEFDESPRNLDPHEMIVISLGTGRGIRKSFPYSKAKKWGATQWLFPVIDTMLSGSSDIVDYQMSKLFSAYDRPDNYKRLNPPLKYSTSPTTDSSLENITNLLKDVNAYIEDNRTFLNVLAREICDIKYLRSYSDTEE